MAGMGGVAHGAAEGIPAALMKSDGTWVGGSDLFIVPRLSPTTLNGREKIDGAYCYKLVAKNPQLGDVTMWIDAKSFLLRQTRRDMSESQHAAQKKSVEEATKGRSTAACRAGEPDQIEQRRDDVHHRPSRWAGEREAVCRSDEEIVLDRRTQT